MSGGGPRYDITTAVVAELYRSGMPVADIAARFDCTPQTIYGRLRLGGIEVTPPIRQRLPEPQQQLFAAALRGDPGSTMHRQAVAHLERDLGRAWCGTRIGMARVVFRGAPAPGVEWCPACLTASLQA